MTLSVIAEERHLRSYRRPSGRNNTRGVRIRRSVPGGLGMLAWALIAGTVLMEAYDAGSGSSAGW